MNLLNVTSFIEKLEEAQKETLEAIAKVDNDTKKKNLLLTDYKQCEKAKLAVINFKTYLIIANKE